MCGVSQKTIKLLCTNPFDGGPGLTPKEVGELTLDEICLLLADKNSLSSGPQRIAVMGETDDVSPLIQSDGSVKVRTADDRIVMVKPTGKSAVQMAMEAEAAKAQPKTKRELRRERKAAEAAMGN